MERNATSNCRFSTWRQRKTMMIGLCLCAVVFSATTYMIYDLSSVNPQLKFNSPREVIYDYKFLLETRYNKAKLKHDEAKQIGEVARKTKKAKPPKEPKAKKEPKTEKAPKSEKKDKVDKNVDPVKPEKHHLTWLVAYPFAGSNVAMGIIQDFTKYSMATNYGDAVDSNRGFMTDFGQSVPVDPDSPTGPYKLHLDLDLPPPGAGNVLVKTHCSGFCVDEGVFGCMLKDYVIPLVDVKDFFLSCASGTHFDGHGHKVLVQYNPWKIQSIMVLVRHPLDMLIARYRDIASASGKMTFDAAGIGKWCEEYDSHKGSIRLENWFGASKELVEKKDIPCHAELYRQVQFYNQVFRSIYYMQEPYHIVHFEDYETDLGGTIQGMMDFLGYRLKENARQGQRVFQRFDENNDPWFTEEQISNMMEFLRSFAKWDETKELFSSYA